MFTEDEIYEYNFKKCTLAYHKYDTFLNSLEVGCQSSHNINNSYHRMYQYSSKMDLYILVWLQSHVEAFNKSASPLSGLSDSDIMHTFHNQFQYIQ